MKTYPTLIEEVSGYSEMIANDPTIKSEFENGKLETRARHTNIKNKWELFYKGLSDVDYLALKNFQQSVMIGSEIFQWVNPKDAQTHNVRFEAPIQFNLDSSEFRDWSATFSLIEA